MEAELREARRERDALLRETLSEEERTDCELPSTKAGRALSREAERMDLSVEELTELLRLERETEEALEAF